MASSSLLLRFPLPNPNKNTAIRLKQPSFFLRRLPLATPLHHLRPSAVAPIRVAGEVPKWRDESSTPDEFRAHLSDVPGFPDLWTCLISAPFLIYTWKIIFRELSHWKNLVFGIIGWVFDLGKPLFYVVWSIVYLVHLCFAIPTTFLIVGIGACYDIIKAIYSSMAYASVQELCTIVILSSMVVVISEAASPNSVNEQSHLLNAATLVGFGAASGFIRKGLFLLSLVGIVLYSMFSKKRDGVATALPPVLVLVAAGRSWIRALSTTAFIAYAIIHHSTSPQDGSLDERSRSQKRPPFPLLFAALAFGICIAAKWTRYRHLAWMTV